MTDDRAAEPPGEPRGNLPPGSGMTGPFGQSADRWQRSPRPAAVVALVVVAVIVIVVVVLIVS